MSDLLAFRLLENSTKLGAAFTSTAEVAGKSSDVNRSEGIETACLGKWGIVRGDIGEEDSVNRRANRPVNVSRDAIGCKALGVAGSSSTVQFV
jgi:hypothetical protein